MDGESIDRFSCIRKKRWSWAAVDVRVRAEGVKRPPAQETARHADVTGRGVASLRRIASTVGIRAFVQDDASRNWTTGNAGSGQDLVAASRVSPESC